MIMRIKTIMWNSESFPVLSQFNSSILFVPPHPIRGGNSVRHSFENWWLIAAFYDCFFFVAQWRKQADSQFREGGSQNSLDFIVVGKWTLFRDCHVSLRVFGVRFFSPKKRSDDSHLLEGISCLEWAKFPPSFFSTEFPSFVHCFFSPAKEVEMNRMDW